MAANEHRKIAAAAVTGVLLVFSIGASVCRPSKWGRLRVMSAYPHLAGDFAL